MSTGAVFGLRGPVGRLCLRIYVFIPLLFLRPFHSLTYCEHALYQHHSMAVGIARLACRIVFDHRFRQYWPLRSPACDRDATLFAAVEPGRTVVPAHPYAGTVSVCTRSAICPSPPPSSETVLPVSGDCDQPSGRSAAALYARHDAGAYAVVAYVSASR